MKIIQRNIVPILFLILCTIGFQYSGLSWMFFANDLITRLARNSFLVISLIIPVLAGMGLNFGIVLGAMAGQFAAFITVVYDMTGLTGFMAACIMAIPFALLFGWLTAILFNRAKGKEMISGLILGFFANGLYQLVCLIFIGWIIPISNPALLLPSGVGFVNTIDLKRWQYALDKFYVLKFKGITIPGLTYLNNINLPVLTLIVIAILCLLMFFLFKTKLGQDFRAVGQNRRIAEVAGIKVDRVRVIAVLFSTVLAAWGQLIFLQNIGNVQVYGSHVQVGTFAVAALLIGGATVSRATIGQALLGTVLFHALFIVSPLAGKNIMGSAQVGEYFRVFIAYGVIGIALALHAWQRLAKK